MNAPRYGRRSAILVIVWLIAYFGARAVLEDKSLALPVRLSAALIPVPLFAAFLWTYIQFVRTWDELERKINLEAVSIAFSLATLLLTTLALLQRAVELKFEDWSYAHVWIYLPIFYLFAFLFVQKKYADE